MGDDEFIMMPVHEVVISSLQQYSAAWMIELEQRGNRNGNRLEFCGVGMMDKHGSD